MQAVDIDEFDPTAGANGDGEEARHILTTPTIKPTSSPPPKQISLSDSEHILSFHLSKKKKSKYQVRLAIHHVGTWEDWRYGEFAMTTEKLNRMIENFKSKVLHPQAPLEKQIPLQIGHGFLDEPPALGWATDLEVEDNVLWGTFTLSDLGYETLENESYSFVSPKYDEEYTSQEIIDGKRTIFGSTLIHVALTNSPVLAELPQIALSKTPTPMDVGVFHPREELMNQPEGEGSQVQQPADPAPPPPASPPASTELTQTQPPPAAPVAAATAPAGQVVLSQSEWEQHQANVRALTERMEREAYRSHSLSVNGFLQEAAGRGVPPVVIELARPILLASNPEAQRTINLGTVEEKVEANIFEAVKQLIEAIPTVTLGQKTPEVGGSQPGAKKMSVEEAEAEGAKLWKSTGIIAEPVGKR